MYEILFTHAVLASSITGQLWNIPLYTLDVSIKAWWHQEAFPPPTLKKKNAQISYYQPIFGFSLLRSAFCPLSVPGAITEKKMNIISCVS